MFLLRLFNYKIKYNIETHQYISHTAVKSNTATMLETILKTDWILKVATIGDELEQSFSNVKNNSQLINTLRKSDIN